MILPALDGLACSNRAVVSTDPSPLRRAWTALRRRRWRRARPFMHLNDHLRRDIGLPPLHGGDPWR